MHIILFNLDKKYSDSLVLVNISTCVCICMICKFAVDKCFLFVALNAWKCMFHFKVTPKRVFLMILHWEWKSSPSTFGVKRTETLGNQARVRLQKPGQIHTWKPQPPVAASHRLQPLGLQWPHCHSRVGFCSEPHISGSIPFLIPRLISEDVNKVGKYFQYEI